jgi:hypothetical protein
MSGGETNRAGEPNRDGGERCPGVPSEDKRTSAITASRNWTLPANITCVVITSNPRRAWSTPCAATATTKTTAVSRSRCSGDCLWRPIDPSVMLTSLQITDRTPVTD